MPELTRRQCLEFAAALAAGAFPSSRRAAAQAPDGCTLSIGTYSLKGIPLEDAIARVAEIGYDGIEIATQPGFDGEPAKLPRERRDDIRKRLEASGLRLTALMEQISPNSDDEQHLTALGRLRRVLAMARALAPRRPPLVQTVLGGGTW